MNKSIQFQPASLEDHKAFIELLLSIIDTKLQFVKHRTAALIDSFFNVPVILEDINEQFLIEDIKTEKAAETASLPREQVFSMIEHYSRTTNLLLLLRTKLSYDNVSLIYDLLSNDKFLSYDHKSLVQMLKQKKD